MGGKPVTGAAAMGGLASRALSARCDGLLGGPVRAYDARVMARARLLIPLGYGKFVRADRVFALVPLEGGERGEGRRTLVHVEGIDAPLVASRSEGAIAREVAAALGQPGETGRADATARSGQEALF